MVTILAPNINPRLLMAFWVKVESSETKQLIVSLEPLWRRSRHAQHICFASTATLLLSKTLLQKLTPTIKQARSSAN
ncbi:hypothetical protein GJAV_G00185200 [Gymnothorax javanicus]|nr:hypothetical protein GJAV_G00185200 [Gymnothorax javanicus]